MTRPGKVILAGTGPGDPELITLKALKYLKAADVVIVDRLVSDDLLRHVRAGATVIRVGKQAGEELSTPQFVINELLVEKAYHNQLVVRLKGGDISFFSNVLDEMKTLVSHDIPFELVPGVTAASGAAAYAGIPLTARGYSSAVRFLTSCPGVVLDEASWKELAATDDTLVFYMSVANVETLCEKFRMCGISPDKCLAVIEQATTPFQKVHLFNILDDEEKIRRSEFASPSLVIVGRVAALHKDFDWRRAGLDGNFFTPLKEISEKHLITVS